ncbi:ribosomal small subunit pseudouridine synthase A [Avibacterium avium]|uniref:Pseudouridine synthase n=2 Tax=Avibacterium avium TaxID=751 RepID=A0A379ARD9_AVIAV|nr:ribosomal small subunit pseudouridine synthase A [Avibacterium avium]
MSRFYKRENHAMRLDKFLAEQTGLTRSQANKTLRQSAVQINGKIEKSGATKVSAEDEIYFDGERLTWFEAGHYIMLNKPQGYVCSNDDGDYPTIYQFFDYPLAGKLHSAGRLDVDTTGLVLLTDDGQWSHRITSPKHHCEKTYLVTLADPVENHYQQACAEGILLRGEKHPTKPAKLEIIDDYNVNLTLSEGRYHQVKRMFAALGNKVIGLHRWKIGDVVLDEQLEEGGYRPLSAEELNALK